MMRRVSVWSQCFLDPASGRVVIDLVKGCTYAFPAQLAQDLADARLDALPDVEVDSLGFNLHWPALDADLHVAALVPGIFGTPAGMSRALARVAGQTTSPTKAAAARSNGARGGRPCKLARASERRAIVRRIKGQGARGKGQGARGKGQGD
jgi:hypothetical protein